jgi:hypothetical protein
MRQALDERFADRHPSDDPLDTQAELVELQVPRGYVAACACDHRRGLSIHQFEEDERTNAAAH